VLNEVCRQSQRWEQAGVAPLPIAVNLSGQDFLRSDFPDFVTGVLLDHGMAPENLELEITEGVVIDNIDKAAAMLDELRRIGVSIALDDFGTGYSSLGYLHRIPIDTLKIDRSLIKNITSDWNRAAITSGVITLSHVLNLKVVAEGVETNEQVDMLKDQKCDEIQGAIYSMPMAPDAAARWVRAANAN
jgi:EAL domain-containing protein (putative c-di-GMP-specific phosphodiesterase class I)